MISGDRCPIRVLDEFKKAQPAAEFRLFDPVIDSEQLATTFPDEHAFARLGDAVSGASVVIIANNHPALGRISPRAISEFVVPDGFVFDYWNHFSHLPPAELGDSYFAVGNSRSMH